jgi:hypothetical protein
MYVNFTAYKYKNFIHIFQIDVLFVSIGWSVVHKSINKICPSRMGDIFVKNFFQLIEKRTIWLLFGELCSKSQT